MKYITGVGSRETPVDIIPVIREILGVLTPNEWVLRSGAANGADSYFEHEAIKLGIHAAIFLPWRGFNGHNSPYSFVGDAALHMASTIHPAWDKLSQAGQKLHGRNCYQVLGRELNTPSSLVICWTPNGKDTGGTRTAIVLARQNNVPVFNLAICGAKEVIDYIKSLP